MNTFVKKIDAMVEAGLKLQNDDQYKPWLIRVSAFLMSAIDEQAKTDFADLGGAQPWLHWDVYRDRQVGYLEGLASRTEGSILSTANQSVVKSLSTSLGVPQPTNRVFLVHGHDVGAKESAARFLEKIGLQPIILHEQANEGRTVIEKFEAFSDVSFAVILLTPDDVGAVAAKAADLSRRARQNVVLELGYFTEKLGRRKVCALYVSGVEVPSDLHGLLYIELDSGGGWKTKLAQELVQAGLKIDIEGLLHA